MAETLPPLPEGATFDAPPLPEGATYDDPALPLGATFDSPAKSAASYIGKVRSDPEVRKQMAGAAGRGIAELLTTGGGLGEYGLPFLSSKEFEQYVRPVVGETPAEYKPLESAVGLAGSLAAGGTVSSLGKGIEMEPSLGDKLVGLRQRMEKIGEAGGELATSKAISEVDRRLEQVPDLKRTIETIEPQVKARHDLSRSEAGLAAPDSRETFEAKKDLNSVVSDDIAKKFKSAEDIQKSVGGKAFEDYKIAAKVKQEAQPFGESVQGKELQKELDTIIGGGPGKFREFGDAAIDIARKIRTELFGRRAEDISLKEVEDRASRMPKSFSQAARENMARQEILATEPRGRRPVDFQLVDDRLRELRQIESSKAPESATAIARGRYRDAADLVENALKSWIGEENYPRAAYAESSEALNAFQNELNLVSRERQKYEPGKGEVVTTRNPSDIMFRDRRSVKLSKDLLGEKEVNAYAERYAANKLIGKTPKDIELFLKDTKNSFVYEVPGLSEKIAKYGESLARREGDVKALEALQTRLSGVTQELPKFSKQAQVANDKIGEAIRRVQTEDPAKLYSTFVDKIRPDLESLDVFSKADLDALEKEISSASQSASRQQAIDTAVGSVLKLGKKVLTLGLLR
jgi:hypothetical protein